MPKPKPADSVALYEALVATQPGVERKGATMPYTSVGGNMFSFLTPDGTLALRLPAPEREEFLQRYRTELCVQHGAVMKEYVRVPSELLARTKELAAHFAVSVRYARTLKPKATTRAKPAAKSAESKREVAAKKGAKPARTPKATSAARSKRSSSSGRAR